MLKRDACGLSRWEITCKSAKNVPLTSSQSRPAWHGFDFVLFCPKAHDQHTTRSVIYIFSLGSEYRLSETRLLKYLKDTRAVCIRQGIVLLLILHRNRSDGTISAITRPRLRNLSPWQALCITRLRVSPILLGQSRTIIRILRRYGAKESFFFFLPLLYSRNRFLRRRSAYVAARWSGFMTRQEYR